MEIARQCNPDNPAPEFTFLMPLRQGVEAWHAAQKNSILWYVKSRPDRSLIPPYKSTARKDDPESGYVGLPDDEEGRERVILANQNVGRRVYNEYLCRMIAMTLRATVRASSGTATTLTTWWTGSSNRSRRTNRWDRIAKRPKPFADTDWRRRGERGGDAGCGRPITGARRRPAPMIVPSLGRR